MKHKKHEEVKKTWKKNIKINHLKILYLYNIIRWSFMNV